MGSRKGGRVGLPASGWWPIGFRMATAARRPPAAGAGRGAVCWRCHPRARHARPGAGRGAPRRRAGPAGTSLASSLVGWWQVSRPEDDPSLILVKADYVALTDDQAEEFIEALRAVREHRSDARGGRSTW